MSLDATKRKIRCDNHDCGQDTSFPIQIDRSLPGTGGAGSSASGWVFVAGLLEERHYCPACAPRVLRRAS